jgi:signal peptidase I
MSSSDAIDIDANSEKDCARRSPWLAVVLSLTATGVGHIYCGRIVRGLMLFCVWFLLLLGGMIGSRMAPSTVVLVTLILIPAVAVVTLYIAACLDAWRLTRQIGSTYQLREYNNPAVYAALLLVGATYPFLVMSALTSNAFEGFYIPENSMSPTLVSGDRILVNKFMADEDGERACPKRFEVVVFKSPVFPDRIWVKRLIGLPGDTIEIRDGRTFVNGAPVPSDVGDSHRSFTNTDSAKAKGSEQGAIQEDNSLAVDADIPTVTTVPENTVFLLGDNLDRSRDSRHFGVVPLRDICGVVEYVYLPADSWSRFGSFQP